MAAPSGVVLGFLSGASAAIAVRIALGSSGGRPSLNEVRKGLFELGVPVDRLTEAATQQAGVFLLDGIDPDGAQLRVKVYGRDAWDAQLLAKAWRALWFRGAATLSLTRLQQVEHEGFLTLLAARNGVPVQDVVRAGRTVDNDAVIVMRVRGDPITVADAERQDETVDAIWDTVLALGAAGLAHGELHLGAFKVERGRALIDNMAGAIVATDQDHRYIDLAQLLTISALLLDADQSPGGRLLSPWPRRAGRCCALLAKSGAGQTATGRGGRQAPGRRRLQGAGGGQGGCRSAENGLHSSSFDPDARSDRLAGGRRLFPDHAAWPASTSTRLSTRCGLPRYRCSCSP